jgi:transposase
MESTAQYWKGVWSSLEGKFVLHLAQARSHAAPHGRKTDYADAERLLRRLVAGDLRLSYVPEAEQRAWRVLARSRVQLTRQRVRLRNQIEGLLEEGQIKLSTVVSDLLGISARRILAALAAGVTGLGSLTALASDHLRATPAQLAEALDGHLDDDHRGLLGMYLEQVELLDRQIEEIGQRLGKRWQSYQPAIERLCEVPGVSVDAAQQWLAEVGPAAAAFPSAAHLASWMGVCPGRQESAGHSTSDRSPKGSRPTRRILNQMAWAAVRSKDTHFQHLFRRLIPRLGTQKALWAVAHHLSRVLWKILHEHVDYVEYGVRHPATAGKRKQRLLRELRRMGYSVQLTPASVPRA